MKQIHLLIIFFAAYHISSFSSENQLDPALKTMINKTLIIEREYTQTHNQKIREYNNQFPKTSQDEIDRWVAKKEREIKENQARYKKEHEQREFDYYVKYHRKKRHQGSPYLKALKKVFQEDHRNTYNPQIKTIECYPTRLLLEWKK